MIRRLLGLLALVLLPVVAEAQVSVTADRIFLGPAPCTIRTGQGPPTVGGTCDFYLNIATGDLFQKVNGTWIDVTSHPVVDTLTARTSVLTPTLGSVNGAITLDPASGVILPRRNYGVSFGTPTQRFLTMHLGELWAETLVSQEVLATIGGRIMVAPTTTLEEDMTTASTSITVKHNNLQMNDIILMQAAPAGVQKLEFMRVTSTAAGSPGAYVYTVTRNIDGSGLTPWIAGDAIVNTGTVGKGHIDLFALTGLLTGYGPTIVGNVRTGTNWNDISPRWAIGNLNNIGYGHSVAINGPQPYGAAFGNPQGAYTYHDDVNGLVMGGPAGVRVQITPTGTATFVGVGTGITSINGGNILTNTITALQIAANAITTEELAAGAVTTTKLNFVPVQSTDVIASINASAEGGGTLRITGNKIEITGQTTFLDGTNPAGKISAGGAAADVNGNLTTIHGGKITTDSITANQLSVGAVGASEIQANVISTGNLNFIPVQNTNVVAYINASTEGLLISGSKIQINGEVTFGAGYNPAAKINNGGAATDINSNFTTINGGKIETNTITATQIFGSTLEAVSADMGNLTSGTISGSTMWAGSGNEVLINANGIQIAGGSCGACRLYVGEGGIWSNNGRRVDIGGPEGVDIYGGPLRVTTSGYSSGEWLVYGDLYAGTRLDVNGNADIQGQTDVRGVMNVFGYTYVEDGMRVTEGFEAKSIVVNEDLRVDRDFNLGDGQFFWSPPYINALQVHYSSGSGKIGSVSSSERYKENIRPFAPANPLAILSVPLVVYDYKAQPAHDIPVQPGLLGMIAEDVYKVAPGIVVLDAQKRPDGINPDGLITHVLAALKAEDARIAELERQVKVLTALVAKLGGGK